MATKGKARNGKTNGTLESAMASLARTVEETRREMAEKMAESQRRMDESQRRTDDRIALAHERTAQAEVRMARAEEQHNELRRHTDEMVFELSKKIDRIEAVLSEHTKVLERLPDAIRQQIGFGRPAQP